MKYQSAVSSSTSFYKGKQYAGPETPLPIIEVYATGCFSGTPMILTKTLQHSFRKKDRKKFVLDSISEHDTTEVKKKVLSEDALQVPDYHNYQTESDVDIDYNSIYSRGGYIEEGEDGELSWFNAGVRVGVGIGLGICLGVGIGVGLGIYLSVYYKNIQAMSYLFADLLCLHLHQYP